MEKASSSSCALVSDSSVAVSISSSPTFWPKVEAGSSVVVVDVVSADPSVQVLSTMAWSEEGSFVVARVSVEEAASAASVS